ncbi:MAG: O-antigen ligase family protein [Chloroflexaceae bacterium]|nr:O-antigen ligase family protein [Chloroflexaceae bacterium]
MRSLLLPSLRFERTALTLVLGGLALLASLLVPLFLFDQLTLDNVLLAAAALALTFWIGGDSMRGTLLMVGLLVAGGVALIFSGTPLERTYRVVIIITIAMLVVQRARQGRLGEMLTLRGADIAVLGFLLVASISYLQQADSSAAANGWNRLIRSVALYFVITRTVLTFTDSVKLYRTGAIAAIVLGVVVMLQNFGLLDVFNGGDRAAGLARDANAVGLMCAATLPWFVWLTRYDWGKWKWVGVAALIASLTVLALTFSRAAFLAAVVALTICLFSSRRPLQDALTYFFTALGIMLALNFLNFTSWDRWETRLTALTTAVDGDLATSSDESLAYRAQAANVSLAVYADHWPTGVGLGNAVATMRLETGQALLPHNSYLDIMVELGLLGFVLFISIFLIPLGLNLAGMLQGRQQDAWRSMNISAAASVVVMLFGFFTLSMSYENTGFLFVSVATAIGIATLRSAKQAPVATAPAASVDWRKV